MGIATGMKDIAKDIASSYDLRMAEVKGLKKEANEMLGSFKASHQDRSAEVKAMRNGFQSSRKEMSSALKKDLAEHTQGVRGEVARLRQEIGASHQDRSAEVKAMRSGFQSSHKKMSSALKKDLADHNRAVKDEASKMRQEIGASHQDMSAKLRKNLARGEAARKSEAQQLRKELAAYDRGIESEVSGMRQETITDLKEARVAWQGLASNMQAKRGRAEILPKAEAPVAKEEIPDLEAKLLAAVNEHLAGVTLVEAAESLGVAPVILGRASKRLLKKGTIRKKGMLYFPASAK